MNTSVHAHLRRGRNWVASRIRWRLDVPSTSYVHPRSRIDPTTVIAEYVFIGPNCTLCPGVSIGRYSMLAPGVSVIGGDHNWDDPSRPIQFSGRPRQRLTTIGHDVWIGQNVIVMRGVRIGDGSVIGAGSVVTRDVPPREVWVGNPARKLRTRFKSADQEMAHTAMLARSDITPHFASRQLPEN